jgi:citrate lyase subunit beta/citryl-CoA lyase
MRSLLFVPGDSDRKLAKSLDSGADALLLDLEDSVAAQSKPKARTMTRDFLKSVRAGAKHPRLYVRTNSLPTGLVDADLEAVIAGRPDGILLPKCESDADVILLDAKLSVAEALAGVEDGATKIIALVTETAAAILNLDYRGASKRLVGLTWGAEDLSADLGAMAYRNLDMSLTDPYRLARTLCLYSAAAARVMPIDSVYVHFNDIDGLRADAAEGVRDGFTGKMAIHPAQIPVINEIFTPTKAALEWAAGVLAAFKANPGAGVLNHKGEMIDKPHIDRAERLIARAKAAGLL